MRAVFVPVAVICSLLALGNLLPPARCATHPHNLSSPLNFHAEVSRLPGWTGPLPSRWFSGFADAGPPPGSPEGSTHMHYIFIESEGSPSSDPILVWYNGGPGASSLFGLLVELGPLLLNAESLANGDGHPVGEDGIPNLIRNEFSWSTVANLLVVNSPPPVGFSFCQPAGPGGNGTSCGAWDDALVATANHRFLTGLLNGALKKYIDNEVFLVGESYAGVYVPVIAREVLRDPQGVRLAGFAVGDGCLGSEVLCGLSQEPYYQLEFFHGHGQVSEGMYRLIREKCTESELRSRQHTPECGRLLQAMREAIGGYYPYGLYDECYWEPGNPFLQADSRSWWGPPISAPTDAAAAGGTVNLPPLGRGMSDHGDRRGKSRWATSNGYPCPGTSFNLWLSSPAVRTALHVSPDSYFFNGDNGAGFDYTLSEKDVRPFHLKVAKETHLRVLVYNGDTDPGINSFVTQDKFVLFWEDAGLELLQDWRPWTLDGQRRLAGYSMEYEGNWTYATVRGSGHMVPEYKPATSLVMLSSFLKGEPLPAYSVASSHSRGAVSPGWNGDPGMHDVRRTGRPKAAAEPDAPSVRATVQVDDNGPHKLESRGVGNAWQTARH